MHHLNLEGNHYEMGVTRGKIFRQCHTLFPIQLDHFQLRHGRHSEELLRAFFPEVCEEIRGVSDTIGVDYLTFASWMLCMGCCMYNLKRNIPVEIRGCTAFAYSAGGRLLYGRNNDLPPWLRDDSKSELYTPRGGSRFYMATSSFINGEEGFNEHGLAVAMTFVMTKPAKIRPGFNSCFIVRYLLEKASDIEQALSLLAPLPIASNCNILLADQTGRMAVIECAPSARKIREAESSEYGSIVCTVNRFISDEMKPYDDTVGNDYGSYTRYQVVMDSFSQGYLADGSIEAAERLLKGDYGFLCQYDHEPDFETVWSTVFDLDDFTIYRAEGDPRKIPFLRDDRLRQSLLL